MKHPTQITCKIPNTSLRLEITKNKIGKWDTKIYHYGKKDKALTLKNNLTDEELTYCLKALISPAIFKTPIKSKKALLNFINNNKTQL